MAVHILHCPSCGQPWKRIHFEKFVRIGPAWRQCRMCLKQFESDESEWLSLKWTARIGYLAQNLLRISPLVLLFAAALLISGSLGMVPRQDLTDYSLAAGLCLLGLLCPLMAWSLIQMLRSVGRTLRGKALAPVPQPAANNKYISDAAWQVTAAARQHPALEPAVNSGIESATIVEHAWRRGRTADAAKRTSLWRDWRIPARNNQGRQSRSFIGEPSAAECGS
jgi:hypothetical protein